MNIIFLFEILKVSFAKPKPPTIQFWPAIIFAVIFLFMIFLVVISTIGFLRIFDQVYSMSEDSAGGPLNATKPLVLMIYDFAFDEFKLGRASALTVILFL